VRKALAGRTATLWHVACEEPSRAWKSGLVGTLLEFKLQKHHSETSALCCQISVGREGERVAMAVTTQRGTRH